MLRGEHTEALGEYRRAAELDPFFYKAYTAMGRVYLELKDYKTALELFEKGNALAGSLMPNITGGMGQAHALLGNRDEAKRLLNQLHAVERERFVPQTTPALIHLMLGEKEEALTLLERGVEAHELSVTSMLAHPAYASLRGEERFENMLQRIFGDSIRGDSIRRGDP